MTVLSAQFIGTSVQKMHNAQFVWTAEQCLAQRMEFLYFFMRNCDLPTTCTRNRPNISALVTAAAHIFPCPLTLSSSWAWRKGKEKLGLHIYIYIYILYCTWKHNTLPLELHSIWIATTLFCPVREKRSAWKGIAATWNRTFTYDVI